MDINLKRFEIKIDDFEGRLKMKFVWLIVTELFYPYD